MGHVGFDRRLIPLSKAGVEPDGRWDMRDGILVFGGADNASFTTVNLEDGTQIGRHAIDNDAPSGKHDTIKPSRFKEPRSLATDGRRVAATFDDGTVKVFDLSGDVVNVINPVGPITKKGFAVALSVAYTPQGQLFLSGVDLATKQFWQPDGSALVRTLDDSHASKRTYFAEDADRFFLLKNDFDVPETRWSLFDSRSLELLDEGLLPDLAEAVAVSPDGTWIASTGDYGGGDGKLIHVTDVTTGETTDMMRDGYAAEVMRFSPTAPPSTRTTPKRQSSAGTSSR